MVCMIARVMRDSDTHKLGDGRCSATWEFLLVIQSIDPYIVMVRKTRFFVWCLQTMVLPRGGHDGNRRPAMGERWDRR
jgi:hypothetical protein